MSNTDFAPAIRRAARVPWVLLVAIVAACASCAARTEVRSLQAALDEQLARNAKRHGTAGQAVLILRNGTPIYRGSHGVANRDTNEPMRTDHVFPVFSVSKLFANVLVAQLVESGALDLQQPASRYAPGLPPAWRAITVGELWNHVSGLPDYFDPERRFAPLPPTLAAAFESLADKPMLFAAGTRTRYTQTNFLILAAILEAHYKMTYRQIVIDRIIKPLALANTHLGKSHAPPNMVASYRGEANLLVSDALIDWPDYAIVHAELYTTIDDLGAFLRAVGEGRLVKRETLLALWKPARLRDGTPGIFAAGWEYTEDGRNKQVGHDGGTKVRVRLVYTDSLATDTHVFIYLTNGSADNVWSRTLVDSVIEIVARHERADARP